MINRIAMQKTNITKRSWSDMEFEAVFRSHWERVYRLAFHLTGCPDDAEDLSLETFWRLWSQPPERIDNVLGWLLRVASNLGYNALRAARRRNQYEQHAGIQFWENAQSESPAQAALLAANRLQVRQALAKLPAQQARLLALRYSGASYQEIAEALNLSPASVGKLLNRAEKQFCQIYGQGE